MLMLYYLENWHSSINNTLILNSVVILLHK
jgi:hypothetical protein